MSETEPIVPTSSVTALRIPIIKKGEYDLWSMKMRQYIAITDHILWDIITNGNQTTTDPASPSVSAPKTSLAANARRNNEKALNILLSAIPDRHLLSFHDAVDARSLWKAIKARFGGNEASKKMQKNLLKQQFETFTIGSREELDSAYERFQHILSMLELHDATVSIEDANLKFLRSLPSVWHVVATMIRGQPGLDELDFDDLYNNLKVYEHELKGVSNSNSQNIAFLSTEVKGSTLKQSTAEPTNIPKGYTQAASSKVPTAPNYASHSDEIICSFFSQQASMPTTHDDEDLLQIDEDAMEEIDIRWQVAMITARIRKFMRKTGRSIDLKPKNGITFDKANGRQEKKTVAIEDSNSKALVATDNNEDIDWTKEFDAEPNMHFEQDGLDDFDWSNKADDAPVSLALMATNSEVPYCSKCSKSYKKLLESYQTERDNFQRARTEILGYQMSLESLEVMLKTHEKNEYAWGDKYEQMEYDLKIRDLKLEEKQKELDQALKERDDFKVKLEKWSNASVLQNEVLNKQRYVSDKSCIGFGIESSNSMESDISSGDETLTDSTYENFKREKAYKAVPPPTGTIIPPRANVSFTGIDELAIRNKVVNQEKTKSSQSAIDRNKVIIEDWVDSDDEETDVSESQKETAFNSENSETSFENRSPNSQNSVGQESRTKGLGNKGGKLCFVCYSPNHLIKDCNLHERTFKHTQTHKPKGTQGSRETRPVWNNIQRVNHSNFSRNSRYPHQRRSFIPSAVLTRDGLISTARPTMTQTVPSKSTANVTYQGTARSRVPQAVLSRSTDGSYYPRMDNRRPRISSYSPSSRSSTTRTPHRPHRPKKIVKSIWVKKGSTVESQAVLPQTVKKSAMINPKQTWRPKGNYLDSVNRDNGSYTLKQFEYGNPEEDLKDYAIIDSGCSGSMTGDKDKLSDFKEFKGGYVAFGNDSKDKECLILSPKFKFVDEDLVILRAPRKNDVYSLDLKNISLLVEITCLVARQQRIKGKQHRASCKKIEERTVREPLELLHMDLFGPVSVESVNRKKCDNRNRVQESSYEMVLCKNGIKKNIALQGLLSKMCCINERIGLSIEAARNYVTDSLLPIHFGLRQLNALLYQLGKFDGKSEEGYLLGYSTSSKGFRVYNRVTRKVQDCLHVNFLENQENQKGKGPDWMFDLDLLTPSMNYIPVRKENYANSGDKVSTLDDVEDLDDQQFIVHTAQPMHPEERTADKEIPLSSAEQALHDELVSLMHQESLAKAHNDDQRITFEEEKKRIALDKGKECVDSTFTLSTANTPPQSTGNTPTDSDDDISKDGVFSTNSFDAEEGGVADYNNMDPTIDVPSTPTLRIHKIHPQSQIIAKVFERREEPKKVSQALADESWVEAMQEELLQFKLQEVWVLCDLPEGKRVIGTKWVFRNKRDERGTIIKNKARLVAQGYRQEEGVDYDEVFAPVARIEAIRLFLAFASFMGFIVYQMDVKSAFLYGNITEEVLCQTASRVFKIQLIPKQGLQSCQALFGLHQGPPKSMEFKMSSMGETHFLLGLQVKQSNGGIFLSQDKYVKDILNKFDFRTIKPASTPIEAHKSLGKDEDGEDVDVHLYRSMIGCLMYLTASRPDIMFAVCLCARFQVTPKVSHLHAVKRIFRYLKHQPKLGLWYPKDSPFHLEAFSDSDYAGDNHDRRSTSGGCQYLGRRLVSWQCKKQTIVAISSTEAEYVAAASCCAQVLWMQNQLLDYGFNFMNTEIHIDNESTICIVKNPVFHSKTKHIQIRHHFIRDCYEQRLINVVKVHTDDNVADLLTKGFDLARFNFLVVTIGMMNP
ncbi:putative ribonuclease H-like domain-containing protein [Tanacetum coccineum]